MLKLKHLDGALAHEQLLERAAWKAANVTATEIRLRMTEAQPAIQRFQASIEHLFIWPLVQRIQWRLRLFEAGRTTRLQLTYTPKD